MLVLRMKTLLKCRVRQSRFSWSCVGKQKPTSRTQTPRPNFFGSDSLNESQNRRHFHVLGIETSCDDSGVAIVDGINRKVVHSSLASQWADHAPYGGIVPSLAARGHDRNLPLLIQNIRDRGYLDLIDAVAVTRGPGMKPCLWVGVNTAIDLARELGKPCIMVNHLQAHTLVSRLEINANSDIYQKKNNLSCGNANYEEKEKEKEMEMEEGGGDALSHIVPSYPFLSLLVSGGHSALVHVKDYDQFTLLGTTLDDAVGEAFDKVARLLQIANRWPETSEDIVKHGGALVETAAKRCTNHNRFKLPIPLSGTPRANCDFSFSGLKTAVRYTLIREHLRHEDKSAKVDSSQALGNQSGQKVKTGIDRNKKRRSSNDFKGMTGVATVPVSDDTAADMAWAFQHTVARHLQQRVTRAIKLLEQSPQNEVREVVMCGGVASNTYLRNILSSTVEKFGLRAVYPPAELCVDNGTMVAYAAVEYLNKHPSALRGPSSCSDNKIPILSTFPDPAGDHAAVEPLPRWLFSR